MGLLDNIANNLSNAIVKKAPADAGKNNNNNVKRGGEKLSNSIMQYDECYANGMIRKGREFSICYEIPNVTFKGLSDEKQQKIRDAYVNILNSFDSYLKITLFIANIREEGGDVSSFLKYPTDRFPVYANELNNLFEEKFANRTDVTTYKFFIIKGVFESVSEADVQFNILAESLDALFTENFEKTGHLMSIGKRLHLMAEIINRDYFNPYLIYNRENDDYTVDAALMRKRRITTDNIVCPKYIKFHTSDFEIDDRVGKSFYLSKIGNKLNTDFLWSLYNIDSELVIAIDMSGIESGDAIKKLNIKYTQILAEVNDKDGFETLEQASEEASIMDMQDKILNNDEKSYNAGLVLTLFAEDKKALSELEKQMVGKCKRYDCGFDVLFASQRYGFASCCMLGFYNVEFKRFLDAHSLGGFMPFDIPEYFDKGGIYYGQHKISKSPIFFNRKKLDNYNGLILGKSGSGKSFFVKKEILLTRLRSPKDNIYIIDPEGEYTHIVEALGGEVINLKSGNGVYLNPLDLDISDRGNDADDPIVEKSDLVASLIETMIGGGIVLSSKSKSVIDRCVRLIYQPYLNHLEVLPPVYGKKVTIDKNACPTLQDLYDKLMDTNTCPEPEARELATSMEQYILGSYDTFAHRSNVDSSNTLIDWNIQGLQNTMMNLGLRVCLSELWNRMIENRKNDTWTRLYIDEFHNLLDSELSSTFCKRLWKQARKWWGAPTGITQNTEDLLTSPAARAIINNTDLTILLRQSDLDQEVLQSLLKLDDTDIKYVSKVKRGGGLIVVSNGDTVIPFFDEFPDNTECFKLFNTSPSRKASEG